MALLSMIHATAGFAGLASGLAIMIMPNKGNRTHKKMGTLYFTSMGFSSMLSVIMSVQLNHPIFLSIGGFTLYMLLAAYLSLPVRFEKLKKLFYPLALVGIACGMYVIYTGIIFLVVFGALQLLLVLQDLRMIWSKKTSALELVRSHARKMAGSFIAATTAFGVNVIFTGNAWWHWMLPTILIVPQIFVWNYQLCKKKSPLTTKG